MASHKEVKSRESFLNKDSGLQFAQVVFQILGDEPLEMAKPNIKGTRAKRRKEKIAVQSYHEIGAVKSPINAVKVSTYTRSTLSQLDVSHAIEKGMPIPVFEDIKKRTPEIESETWYRIAKVSQKTVQRYKQQDKVLNAPETEKILEATEVISKGIEVFGTQEKFMRWFQSPCFALGREKPIDLVSTSYGKEMVLSELGRIDHGILA